MIILNKIKAVLAETQLSSKLFAETLGKDLTTISKCYTDAKFTILYSKGIASLNLGNIARYIIQQNHIVQRNSKSS